MKTAFESFLEPARAESGVWKPVIGLGCIVVVLLIWIAGIVIGFMVFGAHVGVPRKEVSDLFDSLSSSTDSFGIIFQMILFVGVWPSVWLVVTILHKQEFSTLLAPAGNFRLLDFFYGLSLALALWLVTTVSIALVYGLPDRSALTLEIWTIMLPPMIVGIAFQSGAEELVFRGYILQQLAVRWRNPVVWAGVTSVLFVAIHWSGNSFYNAWLLVGGLVLVALVWRTGALLSSIGFHFGGNLLPFNATGHKWSKYDESQLFVFQEIDMSIVFITEIAAMILLLLFIISPFFPERHLAGRT